ncbi:hypothetical protein [Nannocystis pusilla]
MLRWTPSSSSCGLVSGEAWFCGADDLRVRDLPRRLRFVENFAPH